MDPADVQRFLRGDLADDAVQGFLDALRADPDWTVLEPFDNPPERIFQMVYQPTRTPYGFRAVRRDPCRWSFVA